jgi:hypothetical protein
MCSYSGAGYGCYCDSSNIPSAAKAAILQFVNNGGKLIIYDSECPSVDYSWLPYNFSTNNPGPQGYYSGTLYIVEENCLSSNNSMSPYYIDAGYLGSSTDAVCDMNVAVTLDSNWCLDMAGTNYNNVNGPTHIYARYGSGLIIYNGLDLDCVNYSYESTGYGLRRIMEHELNTPFNPTPLSDLPCGVVVSGLSLTPLSATNCIGTSHTLTARVTDNLGQPVEGANVTISVTSGPHMGQSSGVQTSDMDGYVTWSYTGTDAGTDNITASGVGPDGVTQLPSKTVTKTWEVCEEPPVEVGGDIYPTNKVLLLTPWITLGILLAAWGTLIMRRYKAQS